MRVDDTNNIGVTFRIYAKAKTKLFKNGEFEHFFLFEDDGSIWVSLQLNDYMRVVTTATDITIENDNSFFIYVRWKSFSESNKPVSTSLKPGGKKTILMTELDNLVVYKIEAPKNEPKVLNNEPKVLNIVKSEHEIEIKPLKGPPIKNGTVPPTIDFRMSADQGTRMDVRLFKAEVMGNSLYDSIKIKFEKDGKANSYRVTDGTVKFSSRSDDNYFFIESGGGVKIQNLNVFPIAIRIQENEKFDIMYLDNEKSPPKTLILIPNVSKFL